MFAGVFVGRAFKKNGYILPESETTAKAIGFLPLIIAILLLLALIFGLKLGENGAFMQRSKFCSVGAISKIFERDFSMFYGVVSIIVCASVTNLVLNQYKFGFEAQFFVLSMGAGAAISHNFVLASSGELASHLMPRML